MLWLWCRPAATAPIGHLAWELPCAAGVALKWFLPTNQPNKKKKKKKRKRKENEDRVREGGRVRDLLLDSLLLG